MSSAHSDTDFAAMFPRRHITEENMWEIAEEIRRDTDEMARKYGIVLRPDSVDPSAAPADPSNVAAPPDGLDKAAEQKPQNRAISREGHSTLQFQAHHERC